MKFVIDSAKYRSSYFLDEDELSLELDDIEKKLKEDIEKFLDAYPCLKEYGLEIREILKEEEYLKWDEEMYYNITLPAIIEINTLNELVELSNKVKHKLIVDKNKIIIYDDHVE